MTEVIKFPTKEPVATSAEAGPLIPSNPELEVFLKSLENFLVDRYSDLESFAFIATLKDVGDGEDGFVRIITPMDVRTLAFYASIFANATDKYIDASMNEGTPM